MANYNKVFLIGNLTRDPELRYSPAGVAVARLGLAVNRRFKGADDQLKEEVAYLDVKCFGREAENVSQYLKKGAPLLVDGHLAYSQWENKEGEKRSKVEVISERIQFLPKASQPPQEVADDSSTDLVPPLDLSESSSTKVPAKRSRSSRVSEETMASL